MFEKLSDAEIRQACRLRLEAAELWLRRLVHEQLSAVSTSYLTATDSKGARLIKTAIADKALDRIKSMPSRYPRAVDALLTDDLVTILCNPSLYPLFKDALKEAYPDSREEAHTFLNRLIAPRNQLAHANAISLRQAEQVICYAGDLISSLKGYYQRMGQQSVYNVPTIMRVTDSFGNTFERSQMPEVHDGGVGLFLDRKFSLHPGDILTVEIEVDPSFSPESYQITWASTKPLDESDVRATKIVIPVRDVHVGMQWTLQCRIVTNNSWHRMQDGWDDFLLLTYQVLPPS